MATYQAIGRSVQRNRDNTFTVKVEFMDERTGRAVQMETYTVEALEALNKYVFKDLQALKDRDHDVALNAAIVGVLLGEV